MEIINDAMLRYIFILVYLFSLVLTAFPQDNITKKELQYKKKNFLLDEKSWTVELPIWIPGYAGSFAYGDVEIEGESGIDPEQPIEPPPGWDFSGIISRLFTKDWYFKFFFITRIAYEKNKVLFQLDGLTGAIGTSIKFNYNNKEIVQANFTSSNMRLFGAYKFLETTNHDHTFRYELYAYMGFRMHLEKIDSDLNTLINKIDISPFWMEPIIGINNQFAFKRWFFSFQGDFGGFFIDSKYSFQISSYAYYRIGKIISLKMGWNHLQLYQNGIFLRTDYRIKTILSGPTVGIAFHL
ncbi:MAG: hypothetical protein KAH25_00085 [Bacteroidales bacterium]|nr:hypothetical protein [Bacteroidales bacterium]